MYLGPEQAGCILIPNKKGFVMNTEHVHAIGAGPAGLVAAITLAKNGHPVTVYEMNNDVGKRFNGDYQGIENWSTEEDAREFLEAIGIAMDFRFAPYADGDFFNPSGQKYNFSMSRPLFYLLERGTSNWSLPGIEAAGAAGRRSL